MILPKFLAVSGLCAILTNGLVILCVRWGLGTAAASALAFGPVLIVGYALHSLFTFSERGARLSLVRYAVSIALNFPIWTGGLFVLRDLLKVPIVIAAPVMTCLLFVWNFASANWAVLGRAPAALSSALGHAPERRIR